MSGNDRKALMSINRCPSCAAKQNEAHSSDCIYGTPATPLDEIHKLQAAIHTLQSAIRKHRDYRGDDRCWMDDAELYAVLPEGYTPPPYDTPVQLINCQRYIACRHNPATTYVSPQRRIEELELIVSLLESELIECGRYTESQRGSSIDPRMRDLYTSWLSTQSSTDRQSWLMPDA